MDLVHEEQNSAVSARIKGFRKVRRCGSGFRRTTKSCNLRPKDSRWPPARGASGTPGKNRPGPWCFSLPQCCGTSSSRGRPGLPGDQRFADRGIEQTAVEQRGIVAARAPLGRTHACDFLHVLDALAVPLVVEGREMMHRAVPLFVDIRVATLAGVGFMKYLEGMLPPCLVCAELGKNFP